MILVFDQKNRLNPKEITIFIGGQVEQPGEYKIPFNSTLSDAIDKAQGLKIFNGYIAITRVEKSGELTRRKINYRGRSNKRKKENPKLKEKDIIYISRGFLSNTSEVIKQTTNPIVNGLLLYKLFQNE